MAGDDDHPRSQRSHRLVSPLSGVDDRFDPQWAFIKWMLPEDRDSRILDLGCGDGRFARHLCGLGYTNIVGVDVLPQVTADGFEYRVGSLQQIPADPWSFDLILCVSAIYYAEPEAAAEEMVRVLAPGGRVFVSGHTKNSASTAYRLWLRRRRSPKVSHLEAVRFHDVQDYAEAFRCRGCSIDLIDGFYLSPLSRSLVAPAKRRIGWTALSATGPSRWRWLAGMRAHYAYHFVMELSKGTQSQRR